MKSVLISIQPHWVFLIIAKAIGWNIDKEKTVEVRKNRPKDKTWNKVVKIYCSKDRMSFAKIPKEYQPLMERFLGKVFGEFVCDKIVQFENSLFDEVLRETVTRSCVPMHDLLVYLGKQDYGYGWHISDLVIYDKPKELSSFIVPSKTGCVNEGKCKGCIYLDRGNGYNVEDDCNAKFCTDEYKPLRRPPQSWCYVEEVNGNG